MSNALDAENAPAADVQSRETKTKKEAREGREGSQESEAREHGGAWQKARGQAARGAHQQKGRSDRHDEARQGRNAGRDHESDGLAGAHRAWVRQHPVEQRRQKIDSSKNAAGERTYKIAK